MKRQKFKEDPNYKYIDLVELVRKNWRYQPYDCHRIPTDITTATNISCRSKSTTTQRSSRGTSRRSVTTNQPAVWMSHLESSLIPAPRQKAARTPHVTTTILAAPRWRYTNTTLPDIGPTSRVFRSSRSPSRRLTYSKLPSVGPASRVIRVSPSRRTLQALPSRRINQLDNSSLPSTRYFSKVNRLMCSTSINRKSPAWSPQPQVAFDRLEKSSTLKTKFPSRWSMLPKPPRWVTCVKSTIIPIPNRQKKGRKKRTRRGAIKKEPVDSAGSSDLGLHSVYTQYESFSCISVDTNAGINFSDENEVQEQERQHELEADAPSSIAQTSSDCAKDLVHFFSVEDLSVGSARSQNDVSKRSEVDQNQATSIADLVHMSPLDSDGEEVERVEAAASNASVAQPELEAQLEAVNVGGDGESDGEVNGNGNGDGAAENEGEAAEDDDDNELESELGAEEAVDAEAEVEVDTPTHTDEEAGGDGHHNNSSVIEIEITLTSGNDSNSDEDEDEGGAAAADEESDA